MRYLWIALTVFMLNACATNSEADQAAEPIQPVADIEYVEGRDYTVLEQPFPAGAAPVIEFFFYGCRACYFMTDEISEWSHKNNIPVSLVPAHTDTNLVDAARMFHTFNAINRSDLYVYGYILYQEEDATLQGEERINALLAEHNVDQELFWKAWGSDEVNQRLAGSYQLTQMAGVQSTPSFIVAGKYRVELGVIEETAGLFGLLSYLVNKE